MALHSFEQAHRQQGRQGTQQAAVGHVQGGGKIRGYRIELADAGGQTARHIRRTHPIGAARSVAERSLLLVSGVSE